MPVIIRDQVVSDPRDLAWKTRALLTHIGGLEWLRWASLQSDRAFQYEHEENLVKSISVGLHGTEHVHLPAVRLIAAIPYLQQLSDREIAALTGLSPGGDDGQLAGGPVPPGLVGSDELAAIDAFLEQLGVRSHPIFLQRTLTDQLALNDLRLAGQGSRAAGKFAVDRAASPSEFADLYAFYLALPRAHRNAAGASAAMAILAPALFPTLVSPAASGDEHPQMVMAMLRNAPNSIPPGPANLAQGFLELTRFEPGAAASTDTAATTVADYRKTVRALIRDSAVQGATRQDGSRELALEDSTARAKIIWGPNSGTLSLRGLERR